MRIISRFIYGLGELIVCIGILVFALGVFILACGINGFHYYKRKLSKI